jgi:osmoprotectant transport system substrate-binding protein
VKGRNKMRIKKITIISLAIVLMASIIFGGCGSGDKISIGSKDFGESIVLGEMLAQLVENNTDLKVDRKLNMGGTFVCFEAIKGGDIDVYAEYTGTALTAQLNMDVVSDADEAYKIVSEEFKDQFGVKWLEPMGLNNTYALGVTNEVYEEYGVETYSDLAKISSSLRFGSDHEFFDREDGFDGLVETYGMDFKGEPKKMDISLKYEAIGEGDIDVTNVFATDGPIKKYNIKVLEDDKSFFPPYYAAPIVRVDTLEKYPELEGILNLLSGMINDDTMTELNYRIDVQGEDYEEVATDFLKTNGLVL